MFVLILQIDKPWVAFLIRIWMLIIDVVHSPTYWSKIDSHHVDSHCGLYLLAH